MKQALLTLFCLLILSSPCAAQNRTQYLHDEADRLVSAGQFDKALKLYEEAALLSADDDNAYANIGSIYLIKGDFQSAKESFESALQINPDNEMAQAGLEKIEHPDGRSPSEDDDASKEAESN